MGAKSPCAHLSYGAVMDHGGHLMNLPRLLANIISTVRKQTQNMVMKNYR